MTALQLAAAAYALIGTLIASEVLPAAEAECAAEFPEVERRSFIWFASSLACAVLLAALWLPIALSRTDRP